MEYLISPLLDAIFGSLAEAVGLSDWLRDRLKGDPARLALRAALTQALIDASAHYPGRDLRYFAQVLQQVGGPLLARHLQPATPLPTPDELTQRWLNHLTLDSAIHYRQEFAAFAAYFLTQLNTHVENQPALQWVVQARRQRSSEEAIRRMAAASEQSAVTLDTLRQEVTRLTATLETALKPGSSTVKTGGGTYVGRDVRADTFIGRDQITIKNYFVAGLARLVIDYSSRIQDFLLEYLGSKRKRVPFGGRQQQLAELHAWLDDPAAPPYYLMTAEAGRGKSALVCRWLAQLTTRADLAVIFVPISLRFETATQDVVFAALAARLSNLYESEPEKLPPASLTAEQWKGVCQSYLLRTPPEGKRLVVILDGLDEATGWTPGRGLFSADPPDGLRVLVTARSRPGESGASSWAATLGWENPQLARTATLLGLDRRGVEEALISMGDPLDALATKVDVVGELHRLSEGDPLLVRLYVDALVAQGSTVTTLRAEDLRTIQPGLGGYFERWWQDQQEQWRIQGHDPIMEQAHLRLLLNAIAAALGPLLLDDLAALHPDLGDSMLVRRLLQYVNRWLVGDGKQQRYSYSHPRLGYYFWEQLSKREQRAWDERFTAWGEHVLADLNGGALAPAAAPRYLLQHYADHLERSAAPPARFYALISNGWRKAWEELDVSYGGFLNDVDRAWERAKQAYDAHQPGQAKGLVQQVRAALCRSSIATLGSNMPPALLVQLVQMGLRTPVQALALVKLVPNEDRRAKMLTGLAPHLPEPLLEEALVAARAIGGEWRRADALKGLALHLPDPERMQVLGEALAAVRAIGYEQNRADALKGLALHLPDPERMQVLGEALAAVRAIGDEENRADALVGLAPHLPEPLLEEALAAARAIGKEWRRAVALVGLAPHLPKPLLEEALVAARAIWDRESRAAALAGLAPHLPEPLLEEALAAARGIGGEGSRRDALVRLAPHLPDPERMQVLEEALAAARAFEHEGLRAAALARLAPHLPEPLLEEALVAARAFEDQESRADALIALALHLSEYLPDPERMQVLGEALVAVRAFEDERNRADALVGLAPHLPEPLLEEALAAAREFEYEWRRAVALVGLAPHLPEPLLEEALAAAREFEDEGGRRDVLVGLAPHLPDPERMQVLEEALAAARAIGDERSRAAALAGLAPHLPEPLPEEALAAVRAIEDEGSRAAALIALAPYLPEPLLEEALAAARAFEDEGSRAVALIALAPYLPEPLLEEALAAARAIGDEWSRADALVGLAPHLPDPERMQVLEEALAAVREFEDEGKRAAALVGLALYLPDPERMQVLGEALAAARTFEDEGKRAEALIALAPYLPEPLLEEALVAVREFEDEGRRADTLVGLALHLPDPERMRVLEEALAAARAIEDERSRAVALVGLALRLPDPERMQVLEEALVAAREFEDERIRAVALARLAPHLPKPLLEEALAAARAIGHEGSRAAALIALAPHLSDPERMQVLGEALAAVRAIGYERSRAAALVGLAPHLPEPLLEEALVAARAIGDEEKRAGALVGLAPHLPEPLLEEALAAARAIGHEGSHTAALVGLAPHLPEPLLEEALAAARAIGHERGRAAALKGLAPRLADWAAQQPQQSHRVFADSLSVLSARPRPEFLQDLAALMPFLLALAGDETPQAAESIFHAMQEVCGWWP